MRILRQHVMTDRLLGVEQVPMGQAVAMPAAIGVPAAPAAIASTSSKSSVARTAEPRERPAVPAPVPPPKSGTSLFVASAGSPPAAGPYRKIDRNVKLKTLEAMDRDEVQGCMKCALCQARTNTVFGEGDVDAQVMFVGEGPGQNEDEQGRPFVGRAGELLNKQITAMGLEREQVYIANVVKCRPPNNRAPTPDEIDACFDYLKRQIATIQPRVLISLGGPATKTLLNTRDGITKIRGQWHRFDGLVPDGGPTIPVMPTFHPAYLLRSYTVENRKRVWADLQAVMKLMAKS